MGVCACEKKCYAFVDSAESTISFVEVWVRIEIKKTEQQQHWNITLKTRASQSLMPLPAEKEIGEQRLWLWEWVGEWAVRDKCVKRETVRILSIAL